MRNRKYKKITIGGVDYSQYFHFPFMVQRALDESLDFAVIELHNNPIKEPFKPFMNVVIGSGDTALTFITAQDDVEERFGTGLYKHTITVMEKTKETERIICGAKAFTNPLVRDYTDGATRPYYLFLNKLSGDMDWFEYPIPDYGFEPELMKEGSFTSPIIKGKMKFYPFSSFIDFDKHISIAPGTDLATGDVKIYYNEKETALAYKESDKVGTVVFEPKATSTLILEKNDVGLSETFSIENTKDGVYTIIALLKLANGTPKYGVLFDILNVSDPITKSPYTLEEVTLQLLDTCETLRSGLDNPRYRLRYQSAEQMEKFKKPAPEFRFSNGRSLFENLREIGKYVHAMPRIEHDTTTGYDYLFFDELGGTEYADLSKGGRRFGNSASFNVGDYTGGLDSMASNLVNLDDEAEGSITEPFSGGYISMRAERDTARIEEGKGFIKTTYPIEKLISVHVGPFAYKGKIYEGGKITPYVFEKSEYDILSSFSGSYPTSQTYALYYTQGSPNVQGLWYKAQDEAAEISNALEDYSISNILTAVTGVPSGLFDSFDYSDLIFQVTYIPSVTARVRQYKSNYDNPFPSVMVHNQSANKLSAKAFGENLRGQLAMMSNVSKTVMYIFQRLEDVPKAGTLYDDDYYISSVATRVWHDYVIAQIGLSKGYNELGGYVEINNAIRQFEIPESEDRYTVLEEFCEIGIKTKDDPYMAATQNLREEVLNAFSAIPFGRDVSLAFIKTYDDDGDEIPGVPEIALPVISLAIGNSLYFGFRFADNFAAGSKSVPRTGWDNIDDRLEYRLQEYVPYGDKYYSEARYLGFSLRHLIHDSQTTQTLEELIVTAHSLPEAVGIVRGIDMVSTGNFPIIWHKDSADAGCVTYQLHFVTNDDLIIGDGLAYHCPAVRSNAVNEDAVIYFYNHRINQLTGTVETKDCISSSLLVTNATEGYISVPSAVVNTEGMKSWAIIKGGKFMLGKNTDNPPQNIYFNFKRRMKK